MDHYSRTKAIADQLTLMANGTPLPGECRGALLPPPQKVGAILAFIISDVFLRPAFLPKGLGHSFPRFWAPAVSPPRPGTQPGKVRPSLCPHVADNPVGKRPDQSGSSLKDPLSIKEYTVTNMKGGAALWKGHASEK